MKYALFLRGINVGGIRVPMATLKECLSGLGLQNIQTYLQTGNVSFASERSAADLKPAIEKALHKQFNYEAFVLLFPATVIAETVTQYPFKAADGEHRYAVFCLSKDVAHELLGYQKELDTTIEDIAEGGSVVYWRVPKGRSTDTAFAKILARPKYKATTTNRNIHTLEKMLA